MRNFGSKDKQLSSLDTTPRIERTANSGASQLEIPLQREVMANAGQIGRPQTVTHAVSGAEFFVPAVLALANVGQIYEGARTKNRALVGIGVGGLIVSGALAFKVAGLTMIAWPLGVLGLGVAAYSYITRKKK